MSSAVESAGTADLVKVQRQVPAGKQGSIMDTKNYTQVLIDGKIYTLGGSEEEAYLQKAASYVNDKSAQLRRLPGFSKQNADYQTVMTELNIADDYFKAMEWAEGMERQKNDLEKETYSLKHELVSTQMKLEAVLKDLEERQKELDRLTRAMALKEGELIEARSGHEPPKEHIPARDTSQGRPSSASREGPSPGAKEGTPSAPKEGTPSVPKDGLPSVSKDGLLPASQEGPLPASQDRLSVSARSKASSASARSKPSSVSSQSKQAGVFPQLRLLSDIEAVEEEEITEDVKSGAVKEAAAGLVNIEPAAAGSAATAATATAAAVTAATADTAAAHTSGLSDEELARRALKAAKKASSHRGGRR